MEFIENLKFIWKYSKNQKKSYIKLIIGNILNMIFSIITPILSARLIVYLTDNAITQLITIALISFAIDIIQTITVSFSQKHMQIVYRETLRKLQIDLGKEILKIDNNSLDKNGTGVFIQRINGDAGRISRALTSMTNQFIHIITNIGIFIAIFIVNKLAFLVMITLSILLYIVDKIRANVYNENDKKIRKEEEKISSFTSEIVRGAKDIKMLSAENSFIKTLETKINNFNTQKYKMENIDRKYMTISNSTYNIIDLSIILFLAFLLYTSSIKPAIALVLYNYSYRVTSISFYISDLLKNFKDFNLSSQRVMSVLKGGEFTKEQFGNKHLDKVDGHFEFKNVYFSFDNKQILNNLSFEIKPNETVAFVGKSGAGKTTIFNLLCKMYNIDKGQILIDKVDINQLDKESIRNNIIIISQNPYIFNMSIKDNLKLVKENLTEKEMKEACKNACLDEYIESLPKKYDTIVGEGGVNLSGGQRQRLAIARALVQKTEIILFDEATSALDNETQKEIKKAINNLKGEYTILIIAHRLSTVVDSDRILLIDKGQIKEEGTHKQLLKTSTIYQKLYDSELK